MSTIATALSAAFQDYQAGRSEAAEATCRQIIAQAPNQADAWHLLGLIAGSRGDHQQAEDCVRRSWQLNPRNPATLNNLGILLKNQGRFDDAIACYSEVLRLDPKFVPALNNLANIQHDRKQFDLALASCRRAIEIHPGFVDAYLTLGNVLKDMGRLDEAAAAVRHTIVLQPRLAAAHSNLGHILKDQGDLDKALACYRQAVELQPDRATFHGNLAYAMLFHAGSDERAIYAEHVRWNLRHAARFTDMVRPHPNDRSLDRRLRVGYVSPDFRKHSVGRFIAPLLQAHDHRAVDVFCYSSVRQPDEYAAQCQAAADTWRSVLGFSDAQVADLIRQDQIDVLVDLTMHMADNRLLVFARKPAPVQVTYLAYCGSTGLTAMDYRLTDPYLDPSGRDESCYSERSLRLPETYWCYRPMPEATAPGPVPAASTGYVTFGSLNNFCKVSPPTLEVWGRVLHAVPNSRLVLHAHRGSHRLRVQETLVQHGVTAARLIFTDWLDTAAYFRMYEQIDIFLDPFPYGGGTTTCDALWMGVPVVTLAGRTAVGRGGLSILSNLGLADLVAADVDQYVTIATDLARNVARLSELRASLRSRMQSSVLMDEPRFARGIEAAYREMWRRWCSYE